MVALVLALSLSGAAPVKASLVPSLALVGTASAQGGVRLRMTVTNPGKKPAKFCTYHTPFEGIANDIFIVTDEAGAELEYVGDLAKRVPPTADDYLTVAPGKAQVSREVDLREGYRLAPGTYRVRYRGTVISGLPDSEPLVVVVGR